MAYDFPNTSTDYLGVLSTPVTAKPFTMCCWFNQDTAPSAGASILAAITDGNTSNDNRFVIYTGGSNSVNFQTYNGSTADTVSASNTSTNGVWSHVTARISSGGVLKISLDGTNTTGVTSSIVPTGLDRVYIGRTGQTSFVYDGKIAECAIWNTDLNDDEVAQLSKGYAPLLVRPGNLAAYWPLVKPLNDLKRATPLTMTGTVSVSPHPRIFNPHSRRGRRFTTAAGGVTGTLAITNANDTLAASGSAVGFTGTLAKTNANDTLAASGTQTNTGTLAKTNANDTLAGVGFLATSGTLATTNANDTLSARATAAGGDPGWLGPGPGAYDFLNPRKHKNIELSPDPIEVVAKSIATGIVEKAARKERDEGAYLKRVRQELDAHKIEVDRKELKRLRKQIRQRDEEDTLTALLMTL